MPQPQTSETFAVTTARFYCDGGAPTEMMRSVSGNPVISDAGHPRVFLTMTKAGSVDCPYCGRHFVLAAGAESEHAH